MPRHGNNAHLSKEETVMGSTKIFVSVSSLLAMVIFTSFTAAQQVPPPSISTIGEAVVYVTPDEVIVSFGIETFDAELDRAKLLNDDRSGQLVRAIKGLGVDAKYIQTDNLGIEVSYRSNHPWEGIGGYFARRTYMITLKDVKQFEKLVDTSLKNGANQLSGFTFRTTELRKYRDQARSMAAQAAREKAVALAKDLDSTVGRSRQITEGYEGYYGGYGGRMSMMQNAVQVAPDGGGENNETLPAGQIAVRARVSVTFDLK
jgi:hypothetical protein